MKIERISENQIRCTLNKNDLIDRELRINELAYGTEKAKALFHDMMQQASYELGFEAEDIPIMIEAIPVSPDCLVLVVTKVEDPDELDTRFSRFSSDDNIDYDYDDDEEEEYEERYSGEFLDTIADFNEFWQNVNKGAATRMADFIPLSDAVSPKNILEDIEAKNGKNYPPTPTCKIFSFPNLDAVIDLSKQLISLYTGANTLYKDEEQDTYYLILSKDSYSLEDFHKFCNIALEYGKMERTTYATLAYYEEHYRPIIKANAIQMLADL